MKGKKFIYILMTMLFYRQVDHLVLTQTLFSGSFSFFIITYMAVIALIGVPLLTAEISMGVVTRKTAREAYQCLKPGSRWYLAS